MESVSPINRFRFVMANVDQRGWHDVRRKTSLGYLGDSKKFRESTDWETTVW